MRTLPAPRTAEDEAIFDRMPSLDAEWIYEDADRIAAEQALAYARDRQRYDLASPAVRILGASL